MTPLGPSPLAAGDASISVDAARAAIAAALRPIAGVETVPLQAALGRVLAADLPSPIDVPAHDNSAMDGWAFDGAVLRADAPTALRVVGSAHAGMPFGGSVGPAEAVRIMTGAVMPAGLDTVVPQELASLQDGVVQIDAGAIRRGDNRRLRGEDLAQGRAALRAGRLLRPADLGLAASLGSTGLTVRRRLRVALFSTGDELCAPGQPLRPGCVYDSNRSSLHAALQRLGVVDSIDLGVVRDDPAVLRATLQHAVSIADVVLTSGGVSVGDADHTRAVLATLGHVDFWKVAMRPGRPFAFGPLRAAAAATTAEAAPTAVAGLGAKGAIVGDAGPPAGETPSAPPCWLFALPGNPVAALVTFYVFARDGLLQLAGATPQPLPVLQARCTSAIRKRPGRTEFQRAVVAPATDGSGGWQVTLTGSQGAGVLRSMSEANALLVLRHDQASVAAGEPVDVWLFDGLT